MMELSRSSSISSLPSYVSSLLSKRVKPSNIKVKHHRKPQDGPIFNRTKVIKLIATCCCFLEIGIATSLTGATLLDLKLALGVLNDKQSFIILNLSIGDVAGTLIGGFLADRVRIEKLSGTNLIITALAGFSLNWFVDRWIILTCFIILGFTNAFLELVMEVWIINLWAGYGGSITHIAYFFYGLGTFLGPLLASPYLDNQRFDITTKNSTVLNTTVSNSTEENRKPHAFEFTPENPSLVFIPYRILAFYCLFLSMFLITLLTLEPNEDKPKLKQRVAKSNSYVDGLYILIMIFFFLLSQSINGLDMGFGLLLMNFSLVSYSNISKTESVGLSSAYWGAYTFTRIITILLMRYIKDRELMWLHLGITGAGVSILLMSYPNKTFLWISAIIIGAGISPTAPLILSYFNSHIKVTGKIATVFLLADCIGELVYPSAMDYFLNLFPLSFVYITIFSSFSSMMYFVMLDFFIRQRKERLTSIMIKESSM